MALPPRGARLLRRRPAGGAKRLGSCWPIARTSRFFGRSQVDPRDPILRDARKALPARRTVRGPTPCVARARWQRSSGLGLPARPRTLAIDRRHPTQSARSRRSAAAHRPARRPPRRRTGVQSVRGSATRNRNGRRVALATGPPARTDPRRSPSVRHRTAPPTQGPRPRTPPRTQRNTLTTPRATRPRRRHSRGARQPTPIQTPRTPKTENGHTRALPATRIHAPPVPPGSARPPRPGSGLRLAPTVDNRTAPKRSTYPLARHTHNHPNRHQTGPWRRAVPEFSEREIESCLDRLPSRSHVVARQLFPPALSCRCPRAPAWALGWDRQARR